MTCASAPFDIAKTRVMAQKASREKRIYTGMTDALLKTIKNEGVLALWKGFTPQWLRFGPYNIIQLVSMEFLRKMFDIKGI